MRELRKKILNCIYERETRIIRNRISNIRNEANEDKKEIERKLEILNSYRNLGNNRIKYILDIIELSSLYNIVVGKQLIYDYKKYKIVKSEYKKMKITLINMGINFPKYDDIVLSLSKRKESCKHFFEKRISEQESLLKKTKIELFNIKITYIDNQFKPLFDDSKMAIEYKKILGYDGKFKPFSIKGNVKVKTLKNKITVK